MSLKDILVPLQSYPEPTSTAAVERAVALVQAFDAKATAFASELNIPAPGNRIANLLIGLDHMAEVEEQKSRANAQAVMRQFKIAATEAMTYDGEIIVQAPLLDGLDRLCEQARTHDLCIVPITGDEHQQYLVEGLIFDSGRPVLVFSAEDVSAPVRLETVAIAWDASRQAARAVGDALPLLLRAKTVRILTLLNDKASARPGAGSALKRHLAAHEITAVIDEVDAQGVPTGKALEAYAATHQIDLLVMGAYGHSRMREFVLGGATRHVLQRPFVPTVLSH